MPKPELPNKTGPQPWDRRDDETPDSFLAFTIYRDMGEGRSIGAAKKAGLANGTWFHWSTRYDWVERGRAFDVYRRQWDQAVKEELNATEAARIARNQRVFRNNEVHLGRLAHEKAHEILSRALVRDSFIEQRDGKTIIHKATLIGAPYLFAAAKLMEAGSAIGRKGLGMADDESSDVTADSFKKLFYKTTRQIAHDLPGAAMPAMPANPDAKPDIHLPAGSDSTRVDVGTSIAAAPVEHGGNGNGAAGQMVPVAAGALHRFKPARERPGSAG